MNIKKRVKIDEKKQLERVSTSVMKNDGVDSLLIM